MHILTTILEKKRTTIQFYFYICSLNKIFDKMKKIIFILSAVALLGTYSVNAQEIATKAKIETKKSKKAKKVAAAALPKVEGAGMVFENETIDYGTIAHNSEGKREFVFVNNGNKPLIISNTQGSCGCTVPVTPKEPIMPGKKGVIVVKYATDRVGAFSKTVTVTSNATGANVTLSTTPSPTPGGAPVPTGQSTKLLTIKGTVLGDTPAEPTKS